MSARSSQGVLPRLQHGLERLYRVETQLDVRDFLVSGEERAHVAESGPTGDEALARRPAEQMLVRQRGDDESVELALYVDDRALANLEKHDPAVSLGPENFADFCLVVEGVSHFIYVATCAAADRHVTALELELQAEVDKFLCCVFVTAAWGEVAARGLRRRLFEEVTYAADLGSEEKDRYTTANNQAARYAAALESRFVKVRGVLAMLAEVRHFYRMALGAKLAHIARVAG